MTYKLQDLIDISHIQSLLDRLSEIYSFTTAIVDNEGNILTATAWQDICLKFHRRNEESRKECTKSDQYILEHINDANPAVNYRCRHGLMDSAMPIIIDGVHYGNFFTGQFFLENPDLDLFREQARKYGYDETEYLTAVRKVPILTNEQLNRYLLFMKSFLEVISTMGLKQLQTIESRKKIQESEEQYKSIVQTARDGIGLFDLTGRFLQVNEAYCEMSGYTSLELLSMNISDVEAIESSTQTTEHLQRLMAAGRDRFETRHRRKDGTEYDLEVSAQCNVYGSGQITAFFYDMTDRKRAENELRKNEAELRLVINHSSDLIWNLSEEGIFTYASPSWERVTGYAPDSIIGTSFQPLVHPDDIAVCWGYIEKIIQSKVPLPGPEYRVRHADGSWHWHAANATPVLDQKGRYVSMVGVSRDITENKQALDAVREERLLTETLLRSLPGIFYLYTYPELRLVRWNKNHETLLHFEPGEINNRNIFDWHPPERKDLVRQAVELVMEKGENIIESPLLTKEGRLIPFLLTGNKLVFQEASYLLGVGIDITERKRAEETLRESEEFLESIIENLPNMIFLKDAVNLNFVRFNKAGEELLGYNRDDLIGRNDYDFFPKEQADLFTRQDRKVLETGRLFDMPEETVDTKTGRRILHTKKIPIMDKDGNPKYLLGISEDITLHKQAEEERGALQRQLSQAQKMESVGLLAGGVAHDFNNMLTAILGHAEMAMMRCPPSDPIHNDLAAIEQAARRSAELTRQLLAFARKQTVAPKTLDLNDTVAGMFKMLQRLIGEDIDFVWRPSEGLWLVKIDPSQIDQILANLCVNARDAITGVGKITIETRNVLFDETYCSLHSGYLSGGYVMLAVSDDGRGIDKKIIDHIFEPFFTTKESGKGSGLGLATVYGIVRQNKGFINVYSEPGKGSIFKIYLPRVLEGVPEPIDAAMTDIPKGSGEMVLLVEDETLILNVNRLMLEELGYRVLSAKTPGEAILHTRAHADEIRLLITDVIMPEMNGRDLARKLIEIIPDLRCLFTSGYTANVIAHHGVLDADVIFLQKPFSKHDLAVKVHEAMEQK